MALTAGDTLTHYEILGSLGAGAMGEVYRARDSRLGREVAIKVLPERFVEEEERLQRFEREARSLASLNHPNVAQVFGVDQVDDTFFMVMELVPGVDLSERLARGALPLDEALDVCRQLAEGLEAAHEAGVIHRDLKPANVRVTPDGVAKILDFGLAKSRPEAGSGTAELDSALFTEEGVVLGTPTYMSPEQARGRPVDRRTDIWAFGCVLFECLTGQRAFGGGSFSDVAAAILGSEPDEGALPAGTPPLVRALLRRCLMKDPRERLRDAGEARLALAAVQTGAADGGPWGIGGMRDAASTGDRRAGLPLVLLATGSLLGAAVTAGALWLRPVAPPPVVRSDIALPKDLLLAHSFMPGVALSADGRTLAFSAGTAYSEAGINDEFTFFRGALYIRRLGEPDAVPVAGAEDTWQPTFSSDGSRIAYVKRDTRFSGQIETIAVTGGRPTQLTAGDLGIAGLDWSADGRIVFGTNQGLRSIPEGGGPVAELTTMSADGAEALHAFPEVLPGGRGILYTVVFDDRDVSKIAVRVLDPASGRSGELLSNASNARYTQEHLVFARDHTIHAVPFDLETLTLRGEPRPLGISVIQSLEAPNSWFVNGSAQFAVSDTGDLAYAHGAIWPELPSAVAWVSREGDAEVIGADPGSYLAPRIDSAGQRILLSNFYGPNSTIRMHDLARGVTSRVRQGTAHWVAWGPGPDDFTFHQNVGGLYRVGWATIGDTAEPFMLDGPPGLNVLIPDGWSPDGRHLLCVAGKLSDNTDVFAWSEGDGWVKLIDTPEVGEAWPTFSPDGRWIAYAARETRDESRIYVQPFLRAGPAIQVSKTASSAPLWSPDGTELYYISRGNEQATSTDGVPPGSTEAQRWVMAATVTYSDSGLDIGRPERLFRADEYQSVIPIRSWDMGPDGRFLMSLRATEEVVRSAIDEVFPNRIRLIQNWASTLEERAP